MDQHENVEYLQEREPVNVEEIAHVQLSALVEKDEASEQAFCRSMNKLGFACLTLSDDCMPAIHDSYKVAQEFFSSQKKKEYTMGEHKDVGYINMKRIKEFYQMRYSNASSMPWPDSPSEFKEVAHAYYDCMMRITKVCLTSLARGIKVNEEKFLSLLDSDDSREDKENYFSSTLFRYFHYKNKKACDEEPCKTHTDIGMLTIIPATAAHQLLLLNSETFEWITVEKYCKPDVECVVFAGEMLERLTAYYYRAIIHRVGPPAVPQKRYSLVWLCRARPDALLDCVGLNSTHIGPIYWDFREPVTVAEFMRIKYSTKESANGLNTQQVGGKGYPSANYIVPNTNKTG